MPNLRPYEALLLHASFRDEHCSAGEPGAQVAGSPVNITSIRRDDPYYPRVAIHFKELAVFYRFRCLAGTDDGRDAVLTSDDRTVA